MKGMQMKVAVTLAGLAVGGLVARRYHAEPRALGHKPRKLRQQWQTAAKQAAPSLNTLTHTHTRARSLS